MVFDFSFEHQLMATVQEGIKDHAEGYFGPESLVRVLYLYVREMVGAVGARCANNYSKAND